MSNHTQYSSISRRRVLQGGLAGLSLLGTRAYAEAKPIEIGVVTSLSGTFGNIGEENCKGVKMACEYYKQAAGRPIVPVYLDDQGDVGRSVRQVQEVIQKRAIRLFVNNTTSANALAASKEIARNGGVYINSAGADEMTGSECAKSTFRWPVASYSAVNSTIRPFLAKFPDAKKWYTITGQYVFGESLLKNTQATLAELGANHIGNSYHSLSEREYSGYITAAIAAQPDVLAICNFGSQTIDLLRQAVSFGMKRNTKILVIWSTGLDQFQAWGSELCEGIYFGANYWHDIDSPGNRLINDVMRPTLKASPNFLNVCGWTVTQLMVRAINQANSDEPSEVIAALEGMRFDGPTGPETIRPEDHQVVKDYYLMQGKAQRDMRDADDYVAVLAASKALVPVDKTGCKF